MEPLSPTIPPKVDLFMNVIRSMQEQTLAPINAIFLYDDINPQINKSVTCYIYPDYLINGSLWKIGYEKFWKMLYKGNNNDGISRLSVIACHNQIEASLYNSTFLKSMPNKSINVAEIVKIEQISLFELLIILGMCQEMKGFLFSQFGIRGEPEKKTFTRSGSIVSCDAKIILGYSDSLFKDQYEMTILEDFKPFEDAINNYYVNRYNGNNHYDVRTVGYDTLSNKEYYDGFAKKIKSTIGMPNRYAKIRNAEDMDLNSY
jgi:hypothetical protein